MNRKKFYEAQKTFSKRTITEYYISPGIRCKFDILKENIGVKRIFKNGIDLGCSGNSFLYFIQNVKRKSFFDLASLPLVVYKSEKLWHPICGDIIRLPYRDETFDFVSALDVLEHIKNHEEAISEIGRILKKRGISVITIPHRMKYYTKQDQLIGHYRRYEINQIIDLFRKYELEKIRMFGVYGKLMKIADTQATNPTKTEKNIQKLRDKYESEPAFQKIWDFIIKISSSVMKIDAKYHSKNNIMNLGYIFQKV
ncbi:MAG: class I SAM-dependent methyltransferase [Promethearchaeota archaeon]